MTIFQAVIIGIIQGLTEFIPVSSTAHMTICASLMHLVDSNNPERWTAFMAVVQLGTLAAVLIYFSGDIRTIVQTFIDENILHRRAYREQSDDARMGWYVLLGSIPLFAVGYLMKKVIEGQLTKDLHLIAIMLVLVSAVLFVAERISRRHRSLSDMTLKDAVIIGISQCFALIPGTSRSGSTMSAALFLGMNRESSARFSFLLSIPAVAASGLYEFVKTASMLNSSDMVSITIATIISAVTGYISIAFLLKYLRTHSLSVFIVYRVLLAAYIFFQMW